MPRLTSAQRVDLRMTPSQVVSARLLALPTIELSQAVEEELASNPALELTELSNRCRLCGMPSIGPLCPSCTTAMEGDPSSGVSHERDSLMMVAAPRTIADVLLGELRASLDASDDVIAEAVVGNLDAHGFLTANVEEVAALCGVETGRVTRVITQLQSLDLPGVGVRSVREWLLSQVSDRDGQDILGSMVRRIIEHHLDDLAANRDSMIASALDVTLEDVRLARLQIREELRPFPMTLSSGEGVGEAIRYRLPDLVVHDIGGDFSVEVLSSSHRWLRIAPAYQQLASVISRLEPQERDHVSKYVDRARTFLRGLKNRQLTLQRVADNVVTHQQRFLRQGIRYHVPLTRTQVAVELSLHVSSVSRAVSGKTVRLHDRRHIDFSELFTITSDAKKELRRLIEEEDHPMSDEQLAHSLSERGFHLSRRAVAKYRGEMGILSHRLRSTGSRSTTMSIL